MQTKEHWLANLQTICLQNMYNMYKEDLALDNLQCLICHRNQPNQTKQYKWESQKVKSFYLAEEWLPTHEHVKHQDGASRL